MLSVQANHNDDKAMSPKPVNYKEVISDIEYPLVCKEKGIEGLVIVSLKVGMDGKVINHQFETYPCTDLRDAVKDILPELVFEPAKDKDGEVVVGRITIPVNFKLTI